VLKKIFKCFKRTRTQDELLISKIKSLPKNEKYLSKLEEFLKKSSFENVNIQDGEFNTMNKSMSLECCLDVFFEKEYLYLLTIYEDGVVLSKNKNKIEKFNNYSMEEIEQEEIWKSKFTKSILPQLRVKESL